MSYLWTPTSLLTSSTLIMSTLMALSSTNWMFLWASMELNMLSFIPLMLTSKSNQEIEGSIKYFLAQALGSSMLLVFSMMLWTPNAPLSAMVPAMLMISALLKLGGAPCHFWYPSVMASISWMSCLILSSWQKIAPLVILIFFAAQKQTNLMTVAASMNALIGGILGMNQSQMRTIMAYSSIGHIGWIISLSTINMPNMSMVYFLVYCSLIAPLFMILNKMNTYTSKQLTSQYIPTAFQITVAVTLLSLSGLPPLTGFMPKLMVIMLLATTSKFLLLSLIMGSLMNLYFYLNIIINLMMKDKIENPASTPSLSSNSLIMSSSILSMWMIPLIMLYAMTMLN